jgi:PDZ domain-containing protein
LSVDRSTVQLGAVVVVVVGIVVGLLAPVPYVVLSPGPVIDVLGTVDDEPVITISGAKTYPTAGQLDLTTVSESGGPHGRIPLTRVFGGALDSAIGVVPSSLLYPDDSNPQQVEEENAAQMLESQDNAAIAALRHLGLPVTLTVSVAAISKGTPADGTLQVGDVVQRIDGVPMTTGAQVRDEVRKHPPGTVLEFTVLRGTGVLRIPIRTVAATDDATKSMVGFTPKDGYTSPVTVTISIEDIGGPSAGLMLTLGIIDRLTAEQENGGRHVAGTGTIDPDGTVGPIGGIRQKLQGARSDGATIFLVPEGNCAEALQRVPDGLQLVKVTTLDDALSGLAAAVAGRPAPQCTAS